MHNRREEIGPLRLGVTGHRLLAEEDRLRSAVSDALAVLSRRCPAQPLVIYSALAEGADRLVAEEAIKRGASFVTVLPLPAADYLRDFHSAASREQFQCLLRQAARCIQMPVSTSRNEAYWQAGKYIVDQSNVLLALWDGQPAQGRSGTANVVGYARSLCRPLIWVRAGNREPGTDTPTTLGADQGTFTLENFR